MKWKYNGPFVTCVGTIYAHGIFSGQNGIMYAYKYEIKRKIFLELPNTAMVSQSDWNQELIISIQFPKEIYLQQYSSYFSLNSMFSANFLHCDCFALVSS